MYWRGRRELSSVPVDHQSCVMLGVAAEAEFLRLVV
jgi:hypothetical protein